jgi:hypothetical protein
MAIIKVVIIEMNIVLSDMPFFELFGSQSMALYMLRTSFFVASRRSCLALLGGKSLGRREQETTMETRRAR